MRRRGMCLGGEKRGEQEGGGGHRVEAIAVVPGSGSEACADRIKWGVARVDDPFRLPL
jgi:hypothetical protein